MLCCRGHSDRHGHAFLLHFLLHYYFVLGSLYVYIFMTLRTYSMSPFYICFTLFWIPFSQSSIRYTITCVYIYVQFPQFCIFRTGFH